MSGGPNRTGKKQAEQAAREARLAKALRDNLLRRKEQGRAREALDGSTAEGAGRLERRTSLQ